MMKSNDRILEERALRLSKSKEEGKSQLNGLSALIFSIRPERYAIPVQNVIEVVQLAEPVHVPGMPDFVPGFIQRQGKIIPLINLKMALGIEQKGLVDLSKVVIIQASKIVYGVQAENVEGLGFLPEDQLLKGQNHALITATYANSMVLLDPEAFQAMLTSTNH
jgi:purine-binding chemotaxis protein CheW